MKMRTACPIFWAFQKKPVIIAEIRQLYFQDRLCSHDGWSMLEPIGTGAGDDLDEAPAKLTVLENSVVTHFARRKLPVISRGRPVIGPANIRISKSITKPLEALCSQQLPLTAAESFEV